MSMVHNISTTTSSMYSVDMDSHADTCIIGPGFLQLTDTGQRCSVVPFLSSYTGVEDIKVVKAATVVTLPSEEQIILVVKQGLWFGDHTAMKHTLFNPNKLIPYGIEVQDNPFSKEHIGIRTTQGFIPMKTSGTTIYFNCTPPTERDLTLLPRVIVTSPRIWLPQKVSFPKTILPDDDQELQVQQLNLTRDDEDIFMLDNAFDPGFFFRASSSADQCQVNKTMATNIPERH